MRLNTQSVPTVRNFWSVGCWPSDVFPGDANPAHYFVRVHRAELLAAGALSRVGRQRVNLGPSYTGWLAGPRPRVEDISPAVNDQHREAQNAAAAAASA